MNRQITYTGEQISAVDIDNTNLFAMIGLAKLAQAILGSQTSLNGLNCTQNIVPDLNVNLDAGEIYKIENIDNTAYGPIPPDTNHQILKQGIMLNPVLIPLTAPVTIGDSINYLIQITYQDLDSSPDNRPFFGGPPITVQTVREGNLIYSVKTGTPAPTNTQITPTPDVGYVGAWVVTVANGQTQIINSNITQYLPSSFIPFNLFDITGEFLTIAQAALIYLSKVEAQATYLSKVEAQATYLTETQANLLYRPNTCFYASVSKQVAQNIPNLSTDLITFPTVDHDPFSYWSSVNNGFILSKVGNYRISSNIQYNGNALLLILFFDGVAYNYLSGSDVSGGGDSSVGGSIILNSTGGNTVQLYCKAYGGSASIIPFGVKGSTFQVEWIGI